MRRLRILLVEDDAVISALVADVLAELGHDVCGTARTEQEAIDAAALHKPDLMIVDAYLQAGNGVSAMDAILQRSAMPHIFMTGGSRQVIPAQATVLYKPFGKTGLTAALNSLAGQIAMFSKGSALAPP
jgi:DNA-binding response OmpR family regulator